ncbi:MAG: trypsin-like peptidase domain-containing protein [Nitrospirae bacterium]|nr:trypsin-like peptidase domain-containing protein [Nitrospirota bacterium]
MMKILFARRRARAVVIGCIGLPAALLSASSAQAAPPASFAELVKQVSPAVVHISATHSVQRGKRGRPSWSDPDRLREFFGEELYRRFYGEEPPDEQRRRSLGSGFLVSEEGYILTNYHVVEKTDAFRVKLSVPPEVEAEAEYAARVVGKDPMTDLALLKIELKRKFPTVRFGDSDALEVGDWVVAIGNPFGLSHTVTAGIVSAKGRVLGTGPYEDFIQTDAAINMGNSGGPLFNLRGEVVGINTALVSGGQGIGFAIPSNQAKEVLNDLRQKGEVVRGWIGARLQKVTPEPSAERKLPAPRGVGIASVHQESPAARAGLREGDVVVAFDGRPVHDPSELLRLVARATVGKTVPVRISRDGRPLTIPVTVARRPPEPGESPN